MSRMWIGRSFAAFLVAFCGIAHAQISTLSQPGTVIGSFTATTFLTNNGSDALLFTVPAGRAARVTDLFVTSHSLSKCLVYVYTGNFTSPLLEVITQPGSTQHFPMLNGFGLTTGTSLYAYIQSDGDNAISCNENNANQERRVTVRGYYFTVP